MSNNNTDKIVSLSGLSRAVTRIREWVKSLTHSLTIKYKDEKNSIREITIDGKSDQTIDLTSGIYYTTTSQTAERTAGSLQVTSDHDKYIYNGSGVVDIDLTQNQRAIYISCADNDPNEIQVTCSDGELNPQDVEVIKGSSTTNHRIILHKHFDAIYNISNFTLVGEAGKITIVEIVMPGWDRCYCKPIKHIEKNIVKITDAMSITRYKCTFMSDSQDSDAFVLLNKNTLGYIKSNSPLQNVSISVPVGTTSRIIEYKFTSIRNGKWYYTPSIEL